MYRTPLQYPSLPLFHPPVVRVLSFDRFGVGLKMRNDPFSSSLPSLPLLPTGNPSIYDLFTSPSRASTHSPTVYCLLSISLSIRPPPLDIQYSHYRLTIYSLFNLHDLSMVLTSRECVYWRESSAVSLLYPVDRSDSTHHHLYSLPSLLVYHFHLHSIWFIPSYVTFPIEWRSRVLTPKQRVYIQ